jgi:hypothetical protein
MLCIRARLQSGGIKDGKRIGLQPLRESGHLDTRPCGTHFAIFCRSLLRSRLHGNRLLVNTGLNFRNRAIIDRYLFRLSLEHKAMAHP